MLIHDYRIIGNRLLAGRKRSGLTQAEVAEAAGIADRTYADIERGTVNMRIETFLRICEVLHLMPNDVLAQEEDGLEQKWDEMIERLNLCRGRQKETVLKLITVYLDSL